MAETINSLDQLSTVAPAAPAAPVHVQKLDAEGRAYATGKRKNAIARVWLKPGNGKITINGKEFSAFFARPVLQMILQQPIIAVARKDQYDVVATVAGGGLVTTGLLTGSVNVAQGGVFQIGDPFQDRFRQRHFWFVAREFRCAGLQDR